MNGWGKVEGTTEPGVQLNHFRVLRRENFPVSTSFLNGVTVFSLMKHKKDNAHPKTPKKKKEKKGGLEPEVGKVNTFVKIHWEIQFQVMFHFFISTCTCV